MCARCDRLHRMCSAAVWAAFWVVTPYLLVNSYRRFGVTPCILLNSYRRFVVTPCLLLNSYRRFVVAQCLLLNSYRRFGVTPCLLLNSYRRFERTYCLHVRGHPVHGECQQTQIFSNAAVSTSPTFAGPNDERFLSPVRTELSASRASRWAQNAEVPKLVVRHVPTFYYSQMQLASYPNNVHTSFPPLRLFPCIRSLYLLAYLNIALY
jgi:hypothetical protein